MKKLAVIGSLLLSTTSFAAIPIDLSHQQANFLQSFLTTNLKSEQLHTLKSETDFNGTQHIRMQETYQNYPVWGGDIVVHVRHPQNQPLKQQ